MESEKIEGITKMGNIRVKVLDVEQYEEGYPPEGLGDFMAWLETQAANIPEDYRPSARIEIGSNGGYDGSHCGNVEIYYYRPETADEAAAHAARIRSNAVAMRQGEQAEYERLKAKFG